MDGVPAPNPSFPQPIHVVTGNNTISIGNTNYPINLGSIELCKIGNYQDYLYKENGNWYKYGAVGKVILDGTENGWNVRQGSNTNLYVFYLLSTLVQNSIQQKDAMSTHFIQNVVSGLIQYDGGFRITQFSGINRIFICVNSSIASSVNAFKTWLSNNSPSIYYPLETPTTTQITDETLISQLDEIYEHLKLVKGTNNITVTAEDLAPYMELSYMQDIKSKLDNLDSRLALLE